MRKLERAGVFDVILAVADLGEIFVGVLVRGLLKILGELSEGWADDVEAVV